MISGENMRYTKDMNLEDFTLTVNAVNDAPTLLQPLEGFIFSMAATGCSILSVDRT